MSKRKYETYLNEVSEVVMLAEDKLSTLTTLENGDRSKFCVSVYHSLIIASSLPGK